MELASEHRKLLLVDQGAVAGLINVAINGAIAWGLLRGRSSVPLWGDGGMGPDLLITAFLLPALTCAIVSRIVAGQVSRGALPPLPAPFVGSQGWHHHATWVRALLLGCIGVGVAAGPLVLALHLGDAPGMAMGSYVAFKAGWAGLLAVFVSPVVAWWALAASSGPASTSPG